jgi:adenylate cyclase
MRFVPFRLAISTRRKLLSILLAVAIFALLAGLTNLARGRSVVFGTVNAILVGSGVGLFEEFYVQAERGRWMRSIHPLRSIIFYTFMVAIIFVIATNLTHLILYPLYPSPVPYQRLPYVLPIFIVLSVIGVVVMRTVHFIGVENLFHLMVGTYHRPVVQEKIILFLDINNSTGLAETLGAIQTKSMIGKFLFDISKPLTDFGGEIYLYKGDGLIALWDWDEALHDNRILRAISGIFEAIGRERAEFERQFGVVPRFRIGVHGGEVVVSEQGDTKRSIGIYGSTINIAARMEEAAKAHNVDCVISGDVVAALAGRDDALRKIGQEKVKGIATEVSIFEYRCETAS